MGILKINLAARFYEAGRRPRINDERDGMAPYEGMFDAEQAKKMRTIRARVKSDFYSRPEVKVRIVEGLLRDFHSVGC